MENRLKKSLYYQPLIFLAERGGLYCSFFRNSLVFRHFIRKRKPALGIYRPQGQAQGGGFLILPARFVHTDSHASSWN
jgi:hypothetical protein